MHTSERSSRLFYSVSAHSNSPLFSLWRTHWGLLNDWRSFLFQVQHSFKYRKFCFLSLLILCKNRFVHWIRLKQSKKHKVVTRSLITITETTIWAILQHASSLPKKLSTRNLIWMETRKSLCLNPLETQHWTREIFQLPSENCDFRCVILPMRINTHLRLSQLLGWCVTETQAMNI